MMRTAGVDVQRDIPVARAGDVELALDVYRPTQTGEPLPAALYFHGGGWARGSRHDFAETRLYPVAGRGIVVVSASYRLVPQATWPAQLDDARAAFRFVAEHAAEFGVDRARIGAWGSSAGGHIAAMLALAGNVPVHSVATWFAPGDLVSLAADPRPEAPWPPAIRRPDGSARPAEAALVGADSVDSGRERLAAASPISFVSAAAPPFLLVHGDRDPVVPHSQSQRMHDALVNSGARSTLLIVGGANHEDPAIESATVLGAVAALFGALSRQCRRTCSTARCYWPHLEPKETTVPLIDVDLPEGVIPPERREQLAHDLGHALLAAEGLPAQGPILASVTIYLHSVPAGDIYTLAGAGRPAPVRVRVTTAAGSLDADGQRQLVREVTRIIAEAAEDPTLTGRTFVLHSEVAEGGWGVGGNALGRADFDRLNAALKG
jgi:acetyl esterase/lipase/phenylpyruvate tautomerase PptA (4-oxalocrotonate tautomerase family)